MDEISEIQKSVNKIFELKEKTIFAIDAPEFEGTKVSIRGVIINKYKNKNLDFGKVTVKDITGEISLHMNLETFQKNQSLFWKGNCIKCNGVVCRLVKEDTTIFVINNIENVEVVFSSENKEDNIISEKESMLFLSRIVNSCRYYLQNSDFHEIETKLISTFSVEDGLSPLQVVYLGFGEPVYLSTSPSPQLLDFLLTAFLDRVFTVTTSFSPTYRFPGMGTAEKVVVTKFLKLKNNSIEEFLKDIFKFLLKEFKLDETIVEQTLDWGNKFSPPEDDASYYLIKYKTSMPVHRNNVHTNITEIYHIIDCNHTLIMEGTAESLQNNENVRFYTTILYPNQFLSAIHKKPLKSMRNLWRIGNGKHR